MKTTLNILLAAFLAFALGACASKKKAQDQEGQGVSSESAPDIDTKAAMNFDAAGSDSGQITGLSTINFEYDKSALTGEAKKKLQGNAAWLKSHNGVNMQIEGHCDSRGSIEYNLSLGERRAQAVKSYMVSQGIPANRLSVISYGKEKLLTQGDSEADHVKNRRANFLPLN